IVIPPHNQGKLDDVHYYGSRLLVQRLMLEHDGAYVSPIKDPDNKGNKPLQGLNLPRSILQQVYRNNAVALGLR
ncbi:MAG: hypothetical protein ACTSUE_00860, partial [Promethearchaeota archaeon]